MVEQLKRDNGEDIEKQKSDANNDVDDCYNLSAECVMSHICYKYSSMVMSGLIEALDYFAGNQGAKVLVRILAKNIPVQMMEALGVKPEMMQNMSEEQMIEMLPQMIAEKGGPNIKIEKNAEGEYRFTLNECHFLPYSKSKGFCNVTAGLMLGFAQFLSKKPMDIEEIQTIAHGGKRCEFIAREKKL